MNVWIAYFTDVPWKIACHFTGHDRREYDACRALQTCVRCHTSWVVTQERP